MSFWRRQWAEEPTGAQVVFDFVFGVAGPVLCVVFDPGIFRKPDPCFPTFTSIATFAYVGIGMGVTVLGLWLLAGEWLKPGASLFAGIFLGGAFFALGIGLAMLPLSVAGLFLAGLGALGFTPFFTAWVYLRNARRAWRWGREQAEAPARPWRVALALLGLAVALSGPLLAQRLAPPPALPLRNCVTQ